MGFNLDTFLKPNVYFYRDTDCLTSAVEAKISHAIPLCKAYSLNLAASAGSIWGDENFTHYSYWGATADLAYTINPNSTLSAGIRYNGSTKSYCIGSATNPDPRHNAVSYGIQFSTGF